jgi:hypothetical protein
MRADVLITSLQLVKTSDKEQFILDLKFRHVLKVVCFLLRDSPASEVYIPKFRNTLSVPSSYLPAYEDGTDRVFRNVGF